MSEKILDLFDEFVRETKQFWIITGVGISKEDWELTKFIVECVDEYDDEKYTKYISVEKIISKKFWFIEWLVKKDKIKEEIEDMDILTPTWIAKEIIKEISISDTPIDDLCGYLK